MRKENLLTTSFALLFLVMLAVPLPVLSAPEWRYAVHHGHKLMGGVLAGDEFGTYWDNRLPEGWVWFPGFEIGGSYEAYKKYADFKEEHKEYLVLDQLLPSVVDGQVVFQISKWNFLQQVLKLELSEKELGQKIGGFTASTGIRYTVDQELAPAVKEFQELDLATANEKMTKAADSIPFPIHGAGVMILQTTDKQTAKLLVETYGGVCVVTYTVLNDEKRDAGTKSEVIVKPLEGWKHDLDRNGKPDLIWSRDDKGNTSFRALSGSQVALINMTQLK